MSEPDNDTAAAPTRQAAIKPGSIAHRAISWMRAQGQGEEFLTSALAESLNVSPAGVIFALEQALAQGLVQRRQKQPGTRSPFWWSVAPASALPGYLTQSTQGLDLQWNMAGVPKCAEPDAEDPNDDAQPPAPAPAPTPAPTPEPVQCAVPAAVDPPRTVEESWQRRASAPQQQRAMAVAHPPRVPGVPRPFRAALWSDGALLIDVDGAVVVLSPDQAQQIRKLMNGTAA